MQRPTHPRLHVRHVYDAQTILEAVRLGRLRIVSRRLNDAERDEFIRSGSVFVWEESEEESGLRRWTDGRSFGQSRMRGDFLFYEEKIDGMPSPSTSTTMDWQTVSFVFDRMRAEQGYPFTPTNDQNPNALVKQTYSAFFMGPKDTKPRKWHMTAYFTYKDLPNLPTLDTDPILRSVTVPPGMYRSGKARSRPSIDAESAMGGSRGPPPPQYQAWSPSTPSSPRSSLPHSPSSGLPPVHSLLTSSAFPMGSRDDRRTEDQRIIQLLNSRTVL
ncbi:hypothetical protein SISSUDRAFT_984422 [Sistotremastrum suecicum HHB10207 ss-3]|uniref:Gti1/Pac2 family-domain-containing protein n=1 Tax=Sistotremastrum suecicum HHB10207 ss-3 TaxID=1314776 RepID=A0A166ELK5_9AGAM|nr:hypothetical protein SISSUDRAFT_984422 [Sistotremastrum suecicum HHB10207 ss-3]